MMQKGMVLSQADVKKIIAEHFGVAEEQVLATRYSYIVLGEAEEEDKG